MYLFTIFFICLLAVDTYMAPIPKDLEEKKKDEYLSQEEEAWEEPFEEPEKEMDQKPQTETKKSLKEWIIAILKWVLIGVGIIILVSICCYCCIQRYMAAKQLNDFMKVVQTY